MGHQHSRYSQQSSLLTSPGWDSDNRTTYDDSIRPLHVSCDQQSISPNVESLPSEALQSNVPIEGLFATPGLDKRRSINPSVPLSLPTVLPSSASSDHSQKPGGLESQGVNYSAISPHLTAPDNSFKEKPSSRPSSRNDSIYSNPSAADPMQDGRHPRSSRSSSIQANVDDTVVMSSPSSATADLDSSSKALTSVKSLPIQGDPQGKPSSATLSPIDVNVQKRISSPSDVSLEARSANDSRSASPAHRADVPHSIESGTDTEYENEIEIEIENELKRPRKILPPAPPPKDGTRPISYETEADINISEMSQVGDVSEDLLESLRVERTSHSTFIAPALPPIRFSLNTTDFSELLGSVGGMTSLKSLDDAAMLIRQKQNDNAFTPPSLVATPTNEENGTFPLSETSNSQAPTSPAVHSSSDVYDNESSYPSYPRIYLDPTQITITEPGSTNAVSLGRNASDLIYRTLKESSNSAKKTGARHLHVDISLVDAIIKLIESQKAEYHNLAGKMEGMNVSNFPFFSIAVCSNCVEGE